MGIPFRQVVRVGAYVVRQHLAGRKRYPLVLMLEPLFRCNLACAGCGKIDYPDAILDKRMARGLVLANRRDQNRLSLENQALGRADDAVDNRTFKHLSAGADHRPAQPGKPAAVVQNL